MKNRICSVTVGLLSAAIAVCCLYANLLEYGGQWQTWLIFFLTSLAFILFAVLLHEGGHALFGAISNIKVKIEFGFFRTSCCKLIPKTDRNLKGRLILTALGGITFNLLCVIYGVLALFVPAIPVAESCVLSASFYFFLLNAIPMQLADGKTDGLVVWELLRGDDSAKVTLAVLAVQAQVLGGKAIEDVEEGLLFDLPQIREDEESFIALTELRYEYCKARGEEERASGYLARLEQLKRDYPED